MLQGEPLVVLDAPLLFETKVLEYLCHPIIVVSIASRDKQLKRLIERNKDLSKNQAKEKIDSQMPMKLKREKADILVDNDGTRADLEAEVLARTIPAIFTHLKLNKAAK